MAVATLQETRTYGRIIEHTVERILPGVKDNVFTHGVLSSIFLARELGMFGSTPMRGAGRRFQSDGERIRVQHRLGKSTNSKRLAGPWSTVNTAPQDNIRHSAANWRHYSGAVTISHFERLINKGESVIVPLIEDETTAEVTSLVDFAVADLVRSASATDGLTSLRDIISAGDDLQGLSGVTYGDWNSRGLSGRGTAPASVSFASGSFATQGLADMRTCWLNGSEGNRQPNVVTTSYTNFARYEGTLQPQERFTNTSMADGGFQNLAFKSAPVMADDTMEQNASDEFHFLNTDAAYVVVLEGADFDVLPFHEAEKQESMAAKVMFKAGTVCEDRRLLNKMTGVTA